MPFKLIGTILLLVLVAVLTGFNLSNTCSVWFFHTFPNVPVFAMIISSFILGVIVTLPFTFGKKRMQKKLEKAKSDLEEKQKELESKLEKKEDSAKADAGAEKKPMEKETPETPSDKKNTKSKE